MKLGGWLVPGPSQHVLGDAVTESKEATHISRRDFIAMADEAPLSDAERGAIARKLILQSPPGEVMQVANGESGLVKGFGVCWLWAAWRRLHADTHTYTDTPGRWCCYDVGEPQLTRWFVLTVRKRCGLNDRRAHPAGERRDHQRHGTRRVS
jgi:hypothetical protein